MCKPTEHTRLEVSKMLGDRSSLYRGCHHLYGQVAGFFDSDGRFVAHRTAQGGSFFARGVWATEGFIIDDVVVVDDAAWY